MKSSLWVIILVAVAFGAFLVGYSVPPMIEVGMIGGGGEGREIGLKSEVDETMEEYYRGLAAEGGESEGE